MTLIDNWQSAWKFWSFRFAVLVPLLNAILFYLPELGVTPGWMMAINGVLGIVIAYARIIKQPELATDFNEKLLFGSTSQ